MVKSAGYNWKKVMTAKDVFAELNRNGWTLDRIRGSHYIFIKNGFALTVPYHKNIKKGLLEDIKKQVMLADSKTD
jgi:predicted RNA binding protein YcfA (HicA-like mRNA interferase family)